MADKSYKGYKSLRRTEYENRGAAPVYIDTSEILTAPSGKTVMKLRLYNNGAKTVRSAYFNAGCFDDALNLCIQLHNIPYINVDAASSQTFGEERDIEVPDLTRSVFVEVSKILFEDGTSWVNPNQNLDLDIVSEEALGEEWVRLRLTKKIADKNAAEKPKKDNRKKMLILKLVVAATVIVIVAAGVLMRTYLSNRGDAYQNAMNYYINHDYKNAGPALSDLTSNYIFFGDDKSELYYSAGISYMQCGDYQNALSSFGNCRNYKSANENIRAIVQAEDRLVACGYNHSAAVCKDGTVIASGDDSSGQCDVSGWSKIIGVAAGGNHTVGMTYDGMLMAAGTNEYGQCDVSGWTDIVQVAAGDFHTVGLKANGRVIARGNNRYGQCDVQEWSDIIQIAASANHTVGLKSDGTVVAVGWNSYGQCSVDGETDVMFVATGERNTVLVKNDGSVKILGDNSFGQLDSDDSKNIVSASVGARHIVLIDADGKTYSSGDNTGNQCSVSMWKNAAASAAGSSHSIGLSFDGTLLTAGNGDSVKLRDSVQSGTVGAENITITE